uniref:Exocyst complex component 3 like 2 n=1 Tax=Nomascus leucogenys TaxID=61853 RepID=G1QMV7_NOMLE
MPILKNLGVSDPKVTSRNPFEEVSGLEEEEAGDLGSLHNGTSCRRRATLEKLAGLAPFRLGWAPGRRAGSPGDGQPRSFLGRVLVPGIRRSSADFGLLARLHGTRAHGDEEAAGEAARRLAFLRLGRGSKPQRASLAERVVPAGEAAPEPPPKVPEPPKMKEPLSVLEILSLIQQRELARADEHILELEAEELAEGAGGGRRARDVALLYEALQRELWALVRETLAGPGPGSCAGAGAVAQLGQVLVQEEAADGRRGPGAARKLRARWAEAVARAAAAPGAPGGLAGQLEALRARLLEDMAVVRGRLAPAYPAGLGAFGVYLRGYHGALAEWLGASARRRLPLADRYALLHWHNQVYPREVLGLVDMAALENGELGPLLSPGTLRSLEDECVTDVKVPGTLHFGSGSTRKLVTELQLTGRVSLCCPGWSLDLLDSRETGLGSWAEMLGSLNFGSVDPHRALAERLARVGPPESEPAREASASALDHVTRLCHRVVADLLFQELQPHFNKLMRRKWLSSPEALDGIVGTLGAQALALRRMQDEPYQALVAELHRRALVEYVRPLLRGRLRCSSARTRSRVAGRLREDAAQLQRLFRRLESQASWLDAVVPHLAEVMQLEDTPSIQVEVGVLVRDYPDIR